MWYTFFYLKGYSYLAFSKGCSAGYRELAAHARLSPFTFVGVPSASVLGVPAEVNGGSRAFVARSPFLASSLKSGRPVENGR